MLPGQEATSEYNGILVDGSKISSSPTNQSKLRDETDSKKRRRLDSVCGAHTSTLFYRRSRQATTLYEG